MNFGSLKCHEDVRAGDFFNHLHESKIKEFQEERPSWATLNDLERMNWRKISFDLVLMRYGTFISYGTIGTQTEPTKYEYRSWWIVNTLDSLLEVVKSSEDFDLVQVTDPTEIELMLTTMQKLPRSEEGELPDGCLAEAYVH